MGSKADFLLQTTLLRRRTAGVRRIASKRYVASWNALIAGLAHKRSFRALQENEIGGVELGSLMKSQFSELCQRIRNWCGFVDKAYWVFENMSRDKRIVTGNTTILALAMHGDGAGRLEEAFGIVNSMPTVPDVVLWQTLLGACKTYGNVDLAEQVSRKVVEMGSNTSVLLLNVYAANQRWDDVGRVREAMENSEVKKVLGFSYMEVEGVIHTFVNGDQSHSSWREIYRKLEEEEKENALSYHGEKLAVAFGLISMSKGSPIQVIKNLQICGDCHVVIKLVSKIYGREIIVRDRAQFHRFKDGSCSCRDYW
ncbi:tetratricopeptide repeat (TPR)-like superfamily protein [Actinidia rufa]|uniref:Tetratricopeptide repeat (TPR)-like superfamily protein n=1 Tax=Actinidia rufa TaxID=165716 RepID=A0A7J0E0P4_9ERIC|nr:tetratricopeptide repeat (TPR)-like superfamily protein [Actinidia rufa]